MAKRKILPLLAFSCVATFALASCEEGTNIDSIYTQQAHISITTSAGGENKVYTPSEVTMTMDMAAFEKDAYYNTQVMPSTGDVNVLVVPVLVPDYEVDYAKEGWFNRYDRFMTETKRLGLMEVSLCTKEEDVEFRYKLKGDKWSKYVEVKVKDGVYRWQREAVAEDSVANGGEDEEPDMPTIEEAAEQGDVMAQYVLGVCYWNSIEKERDGGEAVKWFEKAAEQGYVDVNTAFVLGNYYYGDYYFSREPNYEKAVKWYKIAAGFGTYEVVEARLKEANKMLKKQSKGKGKR